MLSFRFNLYVLFTHVVCAAVCAAVTDAAQQPFLYVRK